MTDTTTIIKASQKEPLIFEDFFNLGQDESFSPFLKTDSRQWGANLTLKASIIAAGLLLISFALSFHPSTVPISHLTLICVYFLAGIPSLIESIQDLLDLEINIDILMTLAAFSSILIGSGMEGGLLLVLFSISGAMEDAVTGKAKSALNSLHRLSPTKASVIMEDGTLIDRSLQEVVVGTAILVRSGEIVPLDGEVIDGASSVNLGHLTGENLPIIKLPGDTVPAGANNLEGVLTIRVTHTSSDSTLAKIIQLVTQAQEARPTLQRWFDKLSRAYAISIMSLAFLFALTLPYIISIGYFGHEGSIYRALAFLIAASPCALIIAIPIAYLSALSVCAKRGILLKGGITLDALAKCTAAAFDKTGTLTTGELTIEGIDSVQHPQSEIAPEILAIAFALERNTVHPFAKAITKHCETLQLPKITLKDFRTIPGYGVEALAIVGEKEHPVYIGQSTYLKDQLSNDDFAKLTKMITQSQANGELLAVLSVDGQLYLFRFRDRLRPKVKQTLADIKMNWNWRLVMLTGDHYYNAKKIAEEVGIEEFHADLKPEDKLNFVGKIARERGLAMIGDGINDAPALARATVGISMGKVGSAAAIEAADVVFLHDNIERFDWLIGKAFQTRRIVKQNLFLAISAIFVASLPALGGIVPLWLAVVMHEGGTVLVGLNALRLLKK